ncbi:LysE family translocator [Desulforhopalus sp. 52FAK]
MLFFLTFLPQFVDPRGEYQISSYLILGAIFIFTGTIWCLGLAYFSSLSFQNLRSNPKIKVLLNKVIGTIFMGMGIKLIKENT